jgi:Zn-finger nucleic acid-binding protein
MNNPAAGMPCPVCRVPLVMSERQGVEIDYCPQCRGVWLDRGELDKILERSAKDAQPMSGQSALDPQRQRQPAYGSGHQPYGYGHGKRKKSFFEELFD